MKASSDVIIIGAGIIGCLIAHRLAKKGLRVTVVEKECPGEEASWAAAGMLAPQSEAAHGLGGRFSELCFASHRLYPDFIAELEEETGIKIGYHTTGSLFVASDYVEATALAGLLERQQAAGRPAEELSAQQVRELEPALAETIQVGVYLPDDHHVDNRVLMRALVAGAAARGVEFLAETPVVSLAFDNSRVAGIRIPERVLSADVVVNAAGAWAGLVDQTNQIRLPVRPVRGQMVRLELRPQPLHHLVHSSGCYLVPWPDGRVLVGATVENVGYNKDVTAHGIRQLLDGAVQIVPSLDSAPIREVWAGLRPDTEDNLPILGTGRVSNLVVAAGHFRNGILLAPITAQLITELITIGEPSISLDPFSPNRFEV
ncbi:MAG: glycine oxidase ThiO [Acidobacteria bacterium]|nr:glycine oxidase ThiO [Acidobacteriota bacterium]